MHAAFCVCNALYLERAVDVFVAEGRISAIHAHGTVPPPEGMNLVDAGGAIVFPSFIDVHVHLREPGFEWKEDITSGLAAAIHGGFGAVLCMANTKPVNDDPAVCRQILEQAAKAYPGFAPGEGPRVYPIGAPTIGLKGESLAPMEELHKAGCVAFSNDGVPIANTELFRRAMEYAADLGCFLIDHSEDPFLGHRAQMNEGLTSSLMGVKGQPDIGETIQVARAVLLAEYLELPVHIAHVSSKRSVDMIAWAKERGVKVTAETCPHYLLLDDTALIGYRTNAKVSPPLRTPEDVAALRAALKSGVIDMLATDHAPHAAHEKECPLDEAPNGFTGLDLAVATSWQLVSQGVFSQQDFVRLWCEAPAKVFNLPHNSMKAGSKADFFLFDPSREWLVSAENLKSKSCNTPWLGETLRGKVCAHWISGQRLV